VVPSASPATPPRARRAIEATLLFGVLPLVLVFIPGRIVLPTVLLGGLACFACLWRDPSFDRRQLWNAGAARAHARPTLARALISMVALLAVTALIAWPELFRLPRTRPALWVLVPLLYPVVSVYAQELIFRAFFFHRYRCLWARDRSLILASAAAFAFAHLLMRNLPAVSLSLAGGLLFGSTYARSRSLLLVSLEHALLGDWIFTVGLDAFFFDGARSTTGPLRF
jgi:uncharacterized protein